MLELRPIGGFIFGLNLCLLIWRISVQEPAMLEAETAANGIGSSTGGIAYQTSNSHSYDQYNKPLPSDQQLTYSSKHLLSENGLNSSASRFIAAIDVNEDKDDVTNQKLNRKYKYQIFTSHLVVGGNNKKKKNKTDSTILSTATTSNAINLNKTLALSSNMLSKIVNRNKNSTQNPPPPPPPPPPLQSVRKSLAFASASSSATTSSSLQLTSSFVPVLTPKSFHVDFILKTTTPPPTSHATLVPFSLPAPFQENDFSILIDLKNFFFQLPQPPCRPDVKALILVHSAPQNFEKRNLIRKTWASKAYLKEKKVLHILFLLGSVKNETLQSILEEEYTIYNDIVQGNFYDDYRNMTYKHVMAFKWFLYKCQPAEILIKVDDDVFVNTPQLLQYLGHHHQSTENPLPSETEENSSSLTLKTPQVLFNQPKNLLFCDKILESRVKRTFRSKWRVSFKEYNKRFYPPYCPGYAIIYSVDVVKKLYAAAQQHSYFWIDDVLITGILAQATNLSITNLKKYVLFEEALERLLSGKTDFKSFEFIFAWHRITSQQTLQLWEKFQQTQTQGSFSNNSSSSYSLNETSASSAASSRISSLESSSSLQSSGSLYNSSRR